MGSKVKRVTFRMSYDLYAYIVKIAKQENITYSDVVRRALVLLEKQVKK